MKPSMKPRIPSAVLAATLISQSAGAALVSFQTGGTLVPGNTLTGNVTYEGWDDLTTSRINNDPVVAGQNNTRPYGFHSLTNAWSATIASNLGSGSSVLGKTGGYGYIAGGSLHQGVSTFSLVPGGDFFISGTTVTGIETLVFQIRGTNRSEMLFDTSPTLTIGSLTLPSDFSVLYQTIDNYSTGGFGNQDMDWYAFQWDLTGVTIPDGSAYSINWTGLANSGIFELQVNQGDTFVQVIPEPASALLLSLCPFTLLRRRR